MIAAMTRRPAPVHRDEIPTVTVEGRAVPVAVRVNPRARRMTLRMAPGLASGTALGPKASAGSGDGVTLTLPPGVDLAEGLAFVERSRGWIAARLARLPQAVPFAEGAVVPILGRDHTIRHAPWSRQPAWAEAHGESRDSGGILWIGGKPEHMARRVRDHLTETARREICARARAKAARLPHLLGADGAAPEGAEPGAARGLAALARDDLFGQEPQGPCGRAAGSATPAGAHGTWRSGGRPGGAPFHGPCRPLGRITLRDTRSRWGSCSHRGDLNFSWRLVFAPVEVLDYVVAHEVAHLAHLDHSPAFWRLCDALCDTPGWPKAWLKKHGQGLLRYG
jgi:hypothetical protein